MLRTLVSGGAITPISREQVGRAFFDTLDLVTNAGMLRGAGVPKLGILRTGAVRTETEVQTQVEKPAPAGRHGVVGNNLNVSDGRFLFQLYQEAGQGGKISKKNFALRIG